MITKNSLLNIELILSQLERKEEMIVADLGCGNYGFFVFPLAQLVGKSGKVYAVDILKSSLEEIKRKARLENLNQVETVWSNLEKVGSTKISTDSVDVVFLINTLFQADKTIDMLKEATRLLKPSGELIIVDWSEEEASFGPPLTQRVKKDKLKNALVKLGLKLKIEFIPGAYHYGLIFKKS
jgi:ubiquinone/menaquinone biosynthesis C-methylase UbiE